LQEGIIGTDKGNIRHQAGIRRLQGGIRWTAGRKKRYNRKVEGTICRDMRKVEMTEDCRQELKGPGIMQG
jgi:predicted RNase H-like nuclease (RuvC/YqgF family)